MKTYTYEDWERDGDLRPMIGQPVEDRVYYSLRDCVPPETSTRDLMQVGEPWDADAEFPGDLYTTFKRTEQGWVYCGHCLSGKTEDRPGYHAVHFKSKHS